MIKQLISENIAKSTKNIFLMLFIFFLRFAYAFSYSSSSSLCITLLMLHHISVQDIVGLSIGINDQLEVILFLRRTF